MHIHLINDISGIASLGINAQVLRHRIRDLLQLVVLSSDTAA